MMGLVALLIGGNLICCFAVKYFNKKNKYLKSLVSGYTAFVLDIICLSIMAILYLGNIIFIGYTDLDNAGGKYNLTYKDCIDLVTQVVTFLGTAGLTLGTFMYTNSKKTKKEAHHRRPSMRPQPLCRKKHIYE